MKKYIYAGTYTSGLSKGIYRFTFEEGRLSDPVSYYRSVDNRRLSALVS